MPANLFDIPHGVIFQKTVISRLCNYKSQLFSGLKVPTVGACHQYLFLYVIFTSERCNFREPVCMTIQKAWLFPHLHCTLTSPGRSFYLRAHARGILHIDQFLGHRVIVHPMVPWLLLHHSTTRLAGTTCLMAAENILWNSGFDFMFWILSVLRGFRSFTHSSVCIAVF